jgi:peptidoglycan LD-endopeptidase LytH
LDSDVQSWPASGLLFATACRKLTVRSCAFFVLGILLISSCGPAKKGIFADRRTEHQKYGDRIKEAGLDETSLGRLWFAAADKGLNRPATISLPYREEGFFAAEKPSSGGYLFNARRGDRITLSISIVPDTLKSFFGELWKPLPNSSPELVAAIDSTRSIVHDVEDDGTYVIRIQPPLLEAVEYSIVIKTGPSLAFPVSESGDPRMISFWSDPRDGGKRSHQGVDISAKFRTPAVAGADGVVSRVMQNRLGGKVVFLRPEGKNYSLYYAHLDSQVVNSGDKVTTGQVIGLVGNTGNAKGTVPHLHFGIYGWGGAIDPLPFIDPRRKEPPRVTAPQEYKGRWLRTSAKAIISPQPGGTADTQHITRGTAVYVTALAGNFARIVLPEGAEGFVDTDVLTRQPLAIRSLEQDARLRAQPTDDSPAITSIRKDEKYEVMGKFGSFSLVRYNEQIGWLEQQQQN